MRRREHLLPWFKSGLLLAIAVMLTVVVAVPAAPASDDDSAAIRRAIEQAHAAFAAAEVRKDVDAMLQAWSDDIVLMPPGREPLHGRESVADYLSPLPTSRHRVLSERFETVDLRIAGDSAYEVGHVTGEEQAPGAPVSRYRTKYLSVWKRQPDGSWRICRDMWDFIKTE